MALCLGLALTVSATLAAAADPLDTWHTRISPDGTADDWNGVAFGNGRFVIVGDTAGKALTSSDGIEWTAHSVALPRNMYGVVFGKGLFVAAGRSGNIFTSPDGIEWTSRKPDTTAHFNDVSFANDTFLALGDSGAIYTSANGIQWTPNGTASSNYWHGAAFGNGAYAIVGWEWKTASGRTGASADFTNWNPAFSGNSRYLNGVAFGAGKFVACGYAGSFQTSVNGIDWTPPAQAGASTWLRQIIFENGLFVAVGESGCVTTTPDGVTWKRRHSNFSETLQGVAFGKGTFVAAGDDGFIIQSDPVGQSSDIRLTDPARSQADFAFKFTGEVGQTYRIEVSPDLVQWTAVGNVVCTQSPMACAHTAAAGQKNFYRVVKQ